jgi:hypothetical protein
MNKILKALRKIRRLSNFNDHEGLANLNSYESGELLLHINDLAINALKSKSPAKNTKNKEAN